MLTARLVCALFVFSAFALSDSDGAQKAPQPSIEIIDLTQLQATTKAVDDVVAKWEAQLLLQIKSSNGAVPAFKVTSPDGFPLTSKMIAIGNPSHDIQSVRVEVRGTAKLPITVLLDDAHFSKPTRIQIPTAPRVPVPDDFVDSIVLGTLAFGAVTAGLGTWIAGQSLWADMGSQEWKFESWATNTAVAGGVAALLLKIVPGADPPYAQLSAILGFIGGMAPVAYNLTTRAVGAAQRSKVLFFALSAVLTGTSVSGQLVIAYNYLQLAPGEIPPRSVLALDIIIVVIGAAFVRYLVVGVRDAIRTQTVPEALPQRRYSLSGEGSSFTAL